MRIVIDDPRGLKRRADRRPDGRRLAAYTLGAQRCAGAPSAGFVDALPDAVAAASVAKGLSCAASSGAWRGPPTMRGVESRRFRAANFRLRTLRVSPANAVQIQDLEPEVQGGRVPSTFRQVRVGLAHQRCIGSQPGLPHFVGSSIRLRPGRTPQGTLRLTVRRWLNRDAAGRGAD